MPTNIEIQAAHALVEIPIVLREIRDRLPDRTSGEAETLRDALAVEIGAIREKERFFWRGARPTLGANAVAMLLDGIATRLEIVCGFAPAPKGGLKPPAPLYTDEEEAAKGKEAGDGV